MDYGGVGTLQSTFSGLQFVNWLVAPYSIRLAKVLPVGMLNLFRAIHEKPFNTHEQVLLLGLAPYVEHALQTTISQDTPYHSQSMSGVIVMNSKGDVLHLSKEASYLLALVCYPQVSVDAKVNIETVMYKLAQLCRYLDSIFNHQQRTNPPPSWRYKNGRGCFTFHAQWLDQQQTESTALIAINIQHQEPFSIVALRALHKLMVPPTQIEVALYMLQGYSNPQICQQMRIRPNTLKEYINKLYNKLEINHRWELLPKLQHVEMNKLNMKDIQLL